MWMPLTIFKGVDICDLERHSDHRGWLTEVFRQDQLPSDVVPVMGYVSMTLPGVERGPHEHLQQTDVFVFMGPGNFQIQLYDGRVGSETYGGWMDFEAGRANPRQVIVPPGVLHKYKNVSKEPGLVWNFPNQLYRGWGGTGPVDEIRHEDIARAGDDERQDLPDHLPRPTDR